MCVFDTNRPLHVWSNLTPPLSLCGSEGSNLTPAHHYGDFRFKTYAPIAFRYFREMFGIRPDDYMVSSLTQRLYGTCKLKIFEWHQSSDFWEKGLKEDLLEPIISNRPISFLLCGFCSINLACRCVGGWWINCPVFFVLFCRRFHFINTSLTHLRCSAAVLFVQRAADRAVKLRGKRIALLPLKRRRVHH